jgi:uncharacterized protein YjbI with pentapeptide repeats
MERYRKIILIGILLIPFSIGLQPSKQDKQESEKKGNSISNPSISKNENDIEKFSMEIQRLQKEMDKLKLDTVKLLYNTNGLQNKNNASEHEWKWLTDWLTSIGTFFIPIIALFIGSRLNSTQKAKMEQDRKLDREKHLLEVFRELGSPDPRRRIGAASILLQRLDKIPNPKKKDKRTKKRKEEIYEFFSIMSVLIAETKHEETEEVQKYIADGIVDALDARIPEGKKSTNTNESPLKDYDFQGTKLHNAWWRRIDARGVDFYEANLERASLREAFLSKAILKKANLTKTVLEDAHLEFANLQEAILTEAKLARANLKGANLQEACLEKANLKGVHIEKLEETELEKLFPDPKERDEARGKKTDFSKACLIKADLRGVDLSETIIDGANFKGAIFNKGTKLKKEQFKKAEFNRDVSKIVTLID